jgi:hypothetical protein
MVHLGASGNVYDWILPIVQGSMGDPSQLLAILGQNILTAMVPPLLGGTRACCFETRSNTMWKDSFVRRFGNGLGRL